MDIKQKVILREELERRRKAQQTVNDRAKENKKLTRSKNNTPQPPRSRGLGGVEMRDRNLLFERRRRELKVAPAAPVQASDR